MAVHKGVYKIQELQLETLSKARIILIVTYYVWIFVCPVFIATLGNSITDVNFCWFYPDISLRSDGRLNQLLMSSAWNLEEIMFHISFYLNDINVWFSLRGVCRSFHAIFSGRGYWRRWFLHRFGLDRNLKQIEEEIYLLSDVFGGVLEQCYWERSLYDNYKLLTKL